MRSATYETPRWKTRHIRRPTMASLSRLKPGQIVYDVRKDRRGKMATFPVRIVHIFADQDEVAASYNNNPVLMYSLRSIKRWRMKCLEAPTS
jgi:hypothetical protein